MNPNGRFEPRPTGKGPSEPYPNARGAFMLTLAAIVAAFFTSVAFMDFGLFAAVGIGQAIGVGAVATFAAQRVPEPQAARLGLRPLKPDMVPMILCLAPAVLLMSELDNLAFDFSNVDTPPAIESEEFGDPVDGPASEATPELGDRYGDFAESPSTETGGLDERPLEDPWVLIQALIVMAGIAPIVGEFLFRGVILQGLVQKMGMLRGVTLCGFLWMLMQPVPVGGFSRFLAAALGSFALGWLLGIVRISTASILGPMLLASTWAAVRVGSLALMGRMDLPGMNVEGTHLPLLVTAASTLLVFWAGNELLRVARERFSAESGLLGGQNSKPDEPPTPLFR